MINSMPLLLYYDNIIYYIYIYNKVEETLAERDIAAMKGLSVLDTFGESRLGFLPGHSYPYS